MSDRDDIAEGESAVMALHRLRAALAAAEAALDAKHAKLVEVADKLRAERARATAAEAALAKPENWPIEALNESNALFDRAKAAEERAVRAEGQVAELRGLLDRWIKAIPGKDHEYITGRSDCLCLTCATKRATHPPAAPLPGEPRICLSCGRPSHGDDCYRCGRPLPARALPGEPAATPCRGCGKPLGTDRWAARLADGCPCNSPRGINHGLVDRKTCTCIECDPSESGSSRFVDERSPGGIPAATTTPKEGTP